MGITIIIVTHDISLANKVGRVVMISDGKISTEKIMKEDYRRRINDMESGSLMEPIPMRNIRYLTKHTAYKSATIFWKLPELTAIR